MSRAFTHRLEVRLTEVDDMAIRDRARAVGLSRSEYMRRVATHSDDVPRIIVDTDELKRIHTDLRRIGSNLNQIARELNTHHRTECITGSIDGVLSKVAETTDEVANLIITTRNSL